MPPETTATADVAEIRRALALLHEPGSVAELRVLHGARGIISGVAAAAERRVHGDAQ